MGVVVSISVSVAPNAERKAAPDKEAVRRRRNAFSRSRRSQFAEREAGLTFDHDREASFTLDRLARREPAV